MKIRIQQDGAPGHHSPDDEEWCEIVESMGLTGKVVLFNQPANSPDTNLCDLGFFNSIQARYNKEAPKRVEDIISCVDKALKEYPSSLLNRLWITHMSVMNEIILCNGNNDYKIPHMNKERLERERGPYLEFYRSQKQPETTCR